MPTPEEILSLEIAANRCLDKLRDLRMMQIRIYELRWTTWPWSGRDDWPEGESFEEWDAKNRAIWEPLLWQYKVDVGALRRFSVPLIHAAERREVDALGLIELTRLLSAMDMFQGLEQSMIMPFDHPAEQKLERLAIRLRNWANDLRSKATGDEGEGNTTDMVTAEYFKDKFGIESSKLSAARRDGRLKKSKKVGGRWQYNKAEVKNLWPDDFIEDT
jgi:hypothetical protein